MIPQLKTALLALLLAAGTAVAEAQTTFTEPTQVFLMHSSGLHMKSASDYVAKLEASTAASPAQISIVPDGSGYYRLQPVGTSLCLALSGEWEARFQNDADTDAAKFAIEPVTSFYVRLRCKANGKYLGTDANTAEAWVFANKDGQSPLHWWYFSDDVRRHPPVDLDAAAAVGRDAQRGVGAVGAGIEDAASLLDITVVVELVVVVKDHVVQR